MSVREDYDSRCSGWSDIVGHLPYLHSRAAVHGCRVLELGVRSGESTCAFLAAVEAHGGHLWSVDIHQPDVPVDWWGYPFWDFVRGDDQDEAVAQQLPAHVDVLFIDTSHQYRHTLAELDLYGPRVRAGGVILLHDTELEVAPLSNDPEDRDYPVRRAVVEWARKNYLVPEFREGCWGLGVIEIL